MVALGASAELLGPAAALSRALDQVPASAPVRRAMRGAVTAAQPLVTVAEHSAQAELYVFAQSDALMLVSAESETPALLGYTDSYVEGAQLPDAMKMMISAYAAEIAATRAGQVVMGAPAATSRADFDPISPICQTQWNQNAPYNDLAPMIGNTRTYTGCVATAMAQVLKVMQYPAKCSGGTFSYNWATGGTKLSLNFDNVELEWDKMLNTYKSNSPADSRNAVAVLMQACGIATQMDYGTDGSGAVSFNMGTGLIRNFAIDPTLSYLERAWYSIADWNAMVYEELRAGRPVYYSGHTINKEGHAFVVDGYRSDGYFHLNWGWGGLSDGYFLLSALDPEAQGIGGSTSGFDVGQAAFFNLKPKTDIQQSSVPLLFFTQSGFKITNTAVSFGGDLFLSFSAYNGRNFAVSSVSAAVCFTSKATGAKTWVRSAGVSGSLSGYTGFTFSGLKAPTSLAAGEYIVTPGVYSGVTNQYYPVYGPLTQGQAQPATVSGSTITFGATEVPKLWASKLEMPEKINTNKAFTVKIDIANSSSVPFTGTMAVCLYLPDNSVKRATVTTFVANVDGNSTQQVELPAVMTNMSLASGEYEAYLINAETNKRLSDPVAVTLMRPEDLGTLTASNLTLVSAEKNDLTASITVAASGDWAGTVWMQIHNRGDYNSYLARVPVDISLKSGKSTTVTFTTDFTQGIPGMMYTIYFYYTVQGEEKEMNGRQRKTFELLGSADGLNEIEADLAGQTYFDLSGRRVKEPVKGRIYITNNGKKLIY